MMNSKRQVYVAETTLHDIKQTQNYSSTTQHVDLMGFLAAQSQKIKL
ncbi:hypothetical protein SAMN05421828_1152 [Acidiphilium rubrum]|jgi:hypothetical protein|uniref:Uncharacterized protein n=1 Tax=Acidiphilium rubrum TaxID=526 RepID=A0A8G2CLQ5_ACIRU|nr:hypothetical protein SAMN05421828_1152 [Acidiphilium rubrum]